MTLIHFFDKTVDAARLHLEILNAGLDSVYDHVHRVARERVKIVMLAGVTPSQETSLTGVVNAHVAFPLPPDQLVFVSTINGLSGIVTVEPDDAIDGIESEQLTLTTGRVRIGSSLPGPSGALLDNLADRINTLVASGIPGPSGAAGPSGAIGTQGEQGPSGVAGPSGVSDVSVFGAGSSYIEDEGDSSSNATTYQQKVRLTTASLVAGNYRIGWSFEWSGSKTDDDGQEFRMQIDDTTTIMETDPRMQFLMRDRYLDAAGFKHITLAAGIHNIDLDFRSISNNQGVSSSSKNTVTVRRARLEIWRVS